jgi:hypothetical protein
MGASATKLSKQTSQRPILAACTCIEREGERERERASLLTKQKKQW